MAELPAEIPLDHEGHDRRDEDVVPMTPDPDWRGAIAAVEATLRPCPLHAGEAGNGG